MANGPAGPNYLTIDFGTALDVVRAGLGFGFLPEYRVEAALKAGELVALPLEFMARREIPLQLVLTKAEPGPGARALADALYEAMWRQAGRRERVAESGGSD